MTDKTHPDALVKMLCDLAKDHGYGITEITLTGLRAVGDALPEHRYGRDFVVVRQMDGTVIALDA